MPSRSHSKNPPVAKRRKRFLYALNLAQPFLQFFALMAALLVLGRCSPLAPSNERSLNRSASDGVIATHNPLNDIQAEELDIQRALKDAPSEVEELTVISQPAFDSRVSESLNAEVPANLDKVRAVLNQHGRVLTVSLSPAEFRQFRNEGSVRLKLAQILTPKMSPAGQKALFQELRPPSTIRAHAYLVLAPDAMRSSEDDDKLPITLRNTLGVLTDEKAFLQIGLEKRRVDDSQQNLIKSLLDAPSAKLAIILE